VITFDIETGALPWEQLVKLCPTFDAEATIPDPGEFDPASVKVGNLKDAAKIAAKVDEARAAHEEQRRTLYHRRKHAANQHVAAFQSKAALDATTGRVLAIGVLHAGSSVDPKMVECWVGGEADILEAFWRLASSSLDLGVTMCGHNIHGFDLPFLVRRSWILGIDVPDKVHNGRYWDAIFIDTMRRWQLGGRDMVGLDPLCKAFGTEGKAEGMGGADFDKFFHGTPDERQKALDYLRQDVIATRRLADSLQIL